MHLTPFATSRRNLWCRAKSGCGPIVRRSGVVRLYRAVRRTRRTLRRGDDSRPSEARSVVTNSLLLLISVGGADGAPPTGSVALDVSGSDGQLYLQTGGTE